MRKHLSHPDHRARLLAAHYTGKARDTAAVDRLIEMVDDDPELSVRGIATRALGHIGGGRAEAKLVEALSSSEYGIRSWAARGLGRNRCCVAAPLLRQLVASDDHWNVRAQAAIALRRLAPPGAVRPILAAARNERHLGRKLWLVWTAVWLALRRLLHLRPCRD